MSHSAFSIGTGRAANDKGEQDGQGDAGNSNRRRAGDTAAQRGEGSETPDPEASEQLSSGVEAADEKTGPSTGEATYVSVPVPPTRIVRSRQIWGKLLHAAALPLIVGGVVYGLEGEFSTALFRRAWPVMTLLALAYVGAWVLNSKFERYPFVNQGESALLSAGLTLVPAGLVFATLPGSPINTLAFFATVGSIAWYLTDALFHRYRQSHFMLLAGGAAERLRQVPSVSSETETVRSWKGLDGIVADLHAVLPESEKSLADYSMQGVPTYHAGYIYELLTARVLLGASCKTSIDLRARRYFSYVKRVLEVLLIVASLPVTVPIAGLTALAIRLESPGPVLFWQERMGQAGEPFEMAKFRSMVAGNPGEDDDVLAAEGDNRVTTVGRFIRKFRIDELPQFWNVLKGEMSLIGPRPEQVGLAEEFGEDLALYKTRQLVRPGITGLAQVLHGYAGDVAETRRKLEHDLYYVKHRSVSLDLLIIYLTLKTILTGFGAR